MSGPLRAAARAATALAVAALVAGCEAVTDYFADPVLLPCPDYSIPADAANLVQFRPGPGRDLIDVVHQGKIGNLRTACQYHIDKDTDAGRVDLDITVLFAVERGPANKDRKAVYPYFIALTDANKKVLYREELKQRVAFPGNQTRRVLSGEKIVLEVPLKPGQNGRLFRIYAGFVLTRDQLEHNRKLRRAAIR